MWIQFLLSNWRTVAIAVLALSTFGFGYRTGANSVQQDWDKERHQRVVEHLAAVEQNQKTITELQENKHADIAVITGLLGDISDYRVRLRKAPRPGSLPPTSSGGEVQTCASGELLDKTESVLEADRRRSAEIMGDAERDLANRAVVVEWAKRLGK